MSKTKENPYEPPFKLDCQGGIIWDKNDMWSLTINPEEMIIRGWGHLVGIPHGLPADVAARVQDAFGAKVVRLLNKHWNEETT